MQPTFDICRATWHDAQIRHTMDPPSKQDGRGALRLHDLDGRDHDRHHHGWRAPYNAWYRTCQNTRQHISIQQPLKQAMQFFAESVLGRGGAGLAPQHHETSHGFCMPAQRWKSTSITTKAWRHEHLNVTLFDGGKRGATGGSGPYPP